ncbi:MAG: flagellar hook-basal body complex protein FliE [Acetobacteraceae bacterium]|nr:flagellar hook-basal body complex protein FliE [Acetobacteraceae bacterium]
MISSNVTGAAAYAAAQGGLGAQDDAQATTSSSFGSVLQGAMNGLTNLGQDADTKSVQAMTGTGGLTDVVMAVSKAEMALQASVAVRDKVVSAYQEIMRMAV